MPNEFEGRKQIWPSIEDNEPNYPYNEFGIRAIGGKLKGSDKETEQSLRFCMSKKFGWTERKIKKWISDEDFKLKMLVKVYSVNDEPMHKYSEHMIYIRSTEEFGIKAAKGKDGKRLIVGVASSDQVDKHDEIVAPSAVMGSKAEYMEFPTIRNMHMGEPIGQTLDMWQEMNKIWVEIEIHDDEDKIWHKIQKGYLRALSIGFRVLAWEEYCPNGLDEQCYIRFTEIMLVEISVVDSPANTDAIFEVKKQLMKIGGEALVNKMIMKVNSNKQENRTSNIGDEAEKIIELEDEGVKMKKDENKEVDETEGKTEEPETAPVTQEEGETEGEATDEEEGFIPAEEGEETDEEVDGSKETDTETQGTEPDEVKSGMIEMKSDIQSLKEDVDEIKSILESMTDKKLDKIKELEKENKELKEKVEEKKLPKRQSYKDKGDAHEDEYKEKNVDFVHEVAARQLLRLATKKRN